jgi:1-deoxy-D-xylulose-5-phosphate reductoisomerase
MFNKALELIETREFFGFAPDRIEVIVHPQSLIHALVGFRDGGDDGASGPADMRHAIGYALNWPARAMPAGGAAGSGADRPADLPRARRGALPRAAPGARGDATGGLAGAAFNAAKEVALDAFHRGRIGFLDMAAWSKRCLTGFAR